MCVLQFLYRAQVRHAKVHNFFASSFALFPVLKHSKTQYVNGPVFHRLREIHTHVFMLEEEQEINISSR